VAITLETRASPVGSAAGSGLASGWLDGAATSDGSDESGTESWSVATGKTGGTVATDGDFGTTRSLTFAALLTASSSATCAKASFGELAVPPADVDDDLPDFDVLARMGNFESVGVDTALDAEGDELWSSLAEPAALSMVAEPAALCADTVSVDEPDVIESDDPVDRTAVRSFRLPGAVGRTDVLELVSASSTNPDRLDAGVPTGLFESAGVDAALDAEGDELWSSLAEPAEL